MNFGILGAGMIARFHAQAIAAMQKGTLRSVYARRESAAQELAAEFGAKVYTDLDAFLADEQLDIVTVATPSGAHLDPCLQAIQAGKHVACEKPLEVTLSRCDQIIQAAEEAGVKLAGIFNRRFNPAVSHFKKAVEQGRFGKITLCEASIQWWRDQAYYDSGAWRGTWQLDGGGALMNQGIHTIDQLLYLAGPVKRVSASVACLAHERIEVEDTAVAIVEFVSGARGVIQASTACWSSSGHPAEVKICGEKGSAFLADAGFRVWDFVDPEQETDSYVKEHLMASGQRGLGANDPSAIDFSGHQYTFENLVESIEQGVAPAVDGREARKAVELICAIYASADQGGKWVELG